MAKNKERLMNRIKKTAVVLISVFCMVLAGGALVGCAGDEAPTPSMSTSVDRDTALSALNDSEMNQLCADMLDPYMKLFTKERLCIVFAFGVKLANGDCLTTYDACMQKMPKGGLQFPKLQCKGNPLMKTCSATVGEMEDCFNVVLSTMDSTLSKLTCSSVQQDFEVEPNHAKCDLLEKKCPGLTKSNKTDK